jgi:hypothetical protein
MDAGRKLMRASLAVAAALLVAAPAPSATAPQTSWGKLGVSFEQYRADAVSCGRKGYYRDVSNTEAARIFRAASQQIDTISDTGPAPVDKWQTEQVDPSGGAASLSRYDEAPVHFVDVGHRISQVVASTRPEERMAEVGELLQSTVEQCLAARGYQRFQLTPEQQKRLGKLRPGTAERQAYLYGLATDARILEAQAVE